MNNAFSRDGVTINREAILSIVREIALESTVPLSDPESEWMTLMEVTDEGVREFLPEEEYEKLIANTEKMDNFLADLFDDCVAPRLKDIAKMVRSYDK